MPNNGEKMSKDSLDTGLSSSQPFFASMKTLHALSLAKSQHSGNL
jgi:hypothetical protein